MKENQKGALYLGGVLGVVFGALALGSESNMLFWTFTVLGVFTFWGVANYPRS